MRPLRHSINVTVDGCVDHMAGTANVDVHRHATEMLARADALIFGRVTYQMMESAWRQPSAVQMPDWKRPFAETIDAAKKYVVSSTLAEVDWNTELIQGDFGAAIEKLKPIPETASTSAGCSCRWRWQSSD